MLFVKKVIDYSELGKIIIVDNHSVNQSFEVLKDTFINVDKVDVIETNDNGGYASGNNFGIRYAESKYDFDDVIIANPDVDIDESNLHIFMQSKKELDSQSNIKVGIVAPTMINKVTKERNNGWQLPRYADDVRGNFTILNRVFERFFTVQKEAKAISLDYAPVDVIAGAFFAISKDAMLDIGYFDERTFLYCGERILSYKLIEKGYANYTLFNCYFEHEDSASIKSAMSKLNSYKELIKSRKIYQKYYLKVNKIQEALFGFSAMIGITEKRVYFKIKDLLSAP